MRFRPRTTTPCSRRSIRETLKTRPLALKIGGTAWIVRRYKDGLSDELTQNQPVLVVAVQGHYSVIQHSRKQRRIPIGSLDAGSEYQGRSGYWYSEDHPRIQRAISELIEKLEIEGSNDAEIKRLRGILDRHPETD